jgi:hypothetical protein
MLFGQLRWATMVTAAAALMAVVSFAACEPESSDDTDRTLAEFAAHWVPDDGCHYVIEGSDAATTPDACYPTLDGTPFVGSDAFEKLAKTYIGAYLDGENRRIEIDCRPGGDDWKIPRKHDIGDPDLADPCTYNWQMPVWVDTGVDRVKGAIEVDVHPFDEPPTTEGNGVMLWFDVADQFYVAGHRFGENPVAWQFSHPDSDERWVKID